MRRTILQPRRSRGAAAWGWLRAVLAKPFVGLGAMAARRRMQRLARAADDADLRRAPGVPAVQQAIRATMDEARLLLADYSATQNVSFPTVYRLEAAQTALENLLDAARDPGRRPAPDTDRTRVATALMQASHLAQVAREWQQDIYNLQHALYYDKPSPEQRAALEHGVSNLQNFVQQNMSDMERWLRAAERLNDT